MSEAARKIAVIVALDVAGYSARTEADEAKTTAEVAALRKVIEEIAKAHGGRVFNTAGDGFMLEFGSSLAAVEAAHDLAAKCEPKVRVGVHLGDVVVQANGDLLGHGVNVAARLMARSDPGAALISADVRRTIRGPLAERLVSRGLMHLDKMAETIEAFAFGALASTVAMSVPRAEPVLAVLPFDNQSNDPEMVFFSDGVSEEVLQIVARAQGIRVIGKGSSFQFRGDNKSVRKVAQELQASHVLDGSVRRAGDQIRVAAHLVEAASQTTLWTERFDRKLSDVFALQDEIAGTIASKLQAQISLRSRRPVDPAAYDLYLRARKDQTQQWAPDLLKTTELLLEQAVAMAPDFAAAWGFLSVVRGLQIPPFYDSDGSPEHAAVLAAAHRALALDPDCADAVWASNAVLPAFSAYEKKLENTLRSSTLAPSDASILSNRAFALASVGYRQEALAVHRRQVEIDPRLHWAQALCGSALINVGQIDEGLRLLNAAHAQDPENVWTPVMRSIVLAYFAALNGSGMDGALASLESPIPSALSVLPAGAGITRMRAIFKSLLLLRGKSQLEREEGICSLLTSSPIRLISVMHCHVAAALGHANVALRLLHEAKDKNFPIFGGGGGRSHATAGLFAFHASPLRGDPAFAQLCAKLGLAQFWMSSGKWPDCQTEVAYDFKAECEKAAREVAA